MWSHECSPGRMTVAIAKQVNVVTITTQFISNASLPDYQMVALFKGV